MLPVHTHDVQVTSFHASTTYGVGNIDCVPVVRPVAWSSIVCAPICKGRCIVRFDRVCTGSSDREVDAPGVLVCRSKVSGLCDQEFQSYKLSVLPRPMQLAMV